MVAILLKTIAVMFVVLLGSVFGNAIDAPAWSQGFFFAPAVFVFLYLDEEKFPDAKKLWGALAFIVLMSAVGAGAYWLQERTEAESDWVSTVVWMAGLFVVLRAVDWLEGKFNNEPDSDT